MFIANIRSSNGWVKDVTPLFVIKRRCSIAKYRMGKALYGNGHRVVSENNAIARMRYDKNTIRRR